MSTTPAGPPSGPQDVEADLARRRAALVADAETARYRAERDEIIDRLRQAEPERWSYTALARALGCSRELIAQIVRRRR